MNLAALLHAPQSVPIALLKAFNEDQPRDEQGQWTDGGGHAGSAKVSKPIKASTKLTIQDASRELAARGMKLGTPTMGPGFRPVYPVTDAKGNTINASAKEIDAYLKGKGSLGKVNIGALLKAMMVDTAAHQAATSPLNLRPQPTERQAKAGNYAKGHTKVAGIPIAIENPAGSRRRPEWAPLTAHYGYINRTTGADGDHVDVFVRPSTANDWVGDVYVVNQLRQDGSERFDEHKVMVGWPDERSAVRAYLGNYPRGWRLGPVRTMASAEFRTWVRSGDHTVPA